MNRARPLITFCVTAMFLAACTNPSNVDDTLENAPKLTATEAERVADGMEVDLNELGASLAENRTFAALAYVGNTSTGTFALKRNAAVQPSVLSLAIDTLAADHPLPRGVYTYDESSATWQRGAVSSEFEANWRFADGNGLERNADFTLDWDVGVTTVEGVDMGGTTGELPRDARAELLVDGSEVAAFDVDAAWRSTTCGTTSQPTSMMLDGYIGDSRDRIDFDELSLSLTEGGQVHTAGDVVAKSGSASASFGWDVDLIGSFESDDTGCFWTNYVLAGGSLEVDASTTHHSMAFGFDFGQFTYDAYGNLDGLEITDGVLRADGETALTFAGTLDDANGDGVPGERLVLTFADQSMTLETVLVQQEVVARGSTALRVLNLLR